MIVGCGDKIIYHSVPESFSKLLRAVLHGCNVYVALGPIYQTDPAKAIVAPFERSAMESGYADLPLSHLIPPSILEKINLLRLESVRDLTSQYDENSWKDAEDWTRAGLVLEISSRYGICFRKEKNAHVKWKMNGTVTGRFGVEHGSYNPLIVNKNDRSNIIPSEKGRTLAVIDFRAMDLCSMISVVPGLAEKYRGATDPHLRTAEIVGIERDVAKKELFTHAYGGNSFLHREFSNKLPELNWLREKGSGEGARIVQRTSATAFKAGLSKALTLLCEVDVKPVFTVHDELVLDVLNESIMKVKVVSQALEKGASERIGVTYTTETKLGSDYAEAKK